MVVLPVRSNRKGATPWMMQAIYNVADMFIVTMMISVALLVLFGVRLDGTREPRAGARADSAQDRVESGETDASSLGRTDA